MNRRAEYLLRFDDICPTMNWAVWRRVESVLIELDIKPILAVIPDNRDPELQFSSKEQRFWDCVRKWQSRGWTIALHGFQHRMVTRDAGILGKNRYSEFAGLPEQQQREKLDQGLAIFRRENIQSDMLVAPAHSFDANTLRAAVAAGLRSISDGYGLYPHLDGGGMFWIPQQLTAVVRRRWGVWTVCLHANWWTDAQYERFRVRTAAFRRAITDVPAVAGRYGQRRMNWLDGSHAAYWMASERARKLLRGWLR